jgi:hypothetical protein
VNCIIHLVLSSKNVGVDDLEIDALLCCSYEDPLRARKAGIAVQLKTAHFS